MNRRANTGLRSVGALLLCAVVALSACAVLGAPYEYPGIPKQEFVFSPDYSKVHVNGIPMTVLRDPGRVNSFLEVRYLVGSEQDPEGKEGLAHMVEHLLFESTVSDEEGAATFGEALGSLAHHWNAATTIDSTRYLSSFDAAKLKDVLALEKLRAERGCAGIGQEDFLREREVVRNELRERDLGGDGALVRAVFEFIYPPGHPYRRPPGGSDASLQRLTLDDACSFISRYYTPDNMLLVLSGPTPAYDAQRIATKVYEGVNVERVAPTKTLPVALNKVADNEVELDVDEPMLLAFWPMAPRRDADHALHKQVAGGLALALQKQLEDADWASSSVATTLGPANAPVVVAVVSVKDESRLTDARVAIVAAKNELIDSKGEFEHGKVLLFHLFERWQYQSQRAEMFGDYEQFDTRRGSLMRDVREMHNLDEKSVDKATKDFFSTRRARFLTVKASRGSGRLDKDKKSFVFTGQTSVQDSGLEAAPSAEIRAEADRDLPVPEHIGKAQQFRRYRLENGLNLVFWPDGDLPITHAKLVIPVGSSFTSEALRGISNLLPGADDFDVTMFSESWIPEQAHALVFLLAERFRSKEAVIDDKGRQRLSEQLARPEVASQLRYQQEFLRAVYGPRHRYTRVLFDGDNLSALTKGALKSWASEHRSVRDATFIMTGRFDPELMHKLALFHFHALNAEPQPKAEPAPAMPTSAALVEGDDPDADSLQITYAFRGGLGVDESEAARDVLLAILNHRLRDLREVEGLSYGVYARYQHERDRGIWYIEGSVDPAKADRAAAAIAGIVDELRAKPDSYLTEFVLARRQLVAANNASKATPVEAMNKLSFLARYNLEDDFFDNYVRNLARLRVAAVQELIATELAPERRVVGLIGESKARELAKKGLRGEVSSPRVEPPVTPAPAPPASVAPAPVAPPPSTSAPAAESPP